VDQYKGMADAFVKIVRTEGRRVGELKKRIKIIDAVFWSRGWSALGMLPSPLLVD
jgi:hypothetical protein